MSPKAPLSVETVEALVVKRVTRAPALPKIESVGNALVLKASVGCSVVFESIRCAAQTSPEVPGRATTS